MEEEHSTNERLPLNYQKDECDPQQEHEYHAPTTIIPQTPSHSRSSSHSRDLKDHLANPAEDNAEELTVLVKSSPSPRETQGKRKQDEKNDVNTLSEKIGSETEKKIELVNQTSVNVVEPLDPDMSESSKLRQLVGTQCLPSPDEVEYLPSEQVTLRHNSLPPVLIESDIDEAKNSKKQKRRKTVDGDDRNKGDESTTNDMSNSSIASLRLGAMDKHGMVSKKVTFGEGTIFIQKVSTAPAASKQIKKTQKLAHTNGKRKMIGATNLMSQGNNATVKNGNAHNGPQIPPNNRQISQSQVMSVDPSNDQESKIPLVAVPLAGFNELKPSNISPNGANPTSLAVIDNPTHKVTTTKTTIDFAKDLSDTEDRKNVTVSLRRASTYVFEEELNAEEKHKYNAREWYCPTRCLDFCMHRTCFGRLFILLISWTTVLDYCKDFYVVFRLLTCDKIPLFVISLIILFLSLRLFLFLRATDDDKITFWKLFIFYFPGSVWADSRFDSKSDVAICCLWEVLILLGTPLIPFYLVYLAMKKSFSLFYGKNFENPYLLAYAVVECVFETTPQLILQTYVFSTQSHENVPIHKIVIYIIWAISGLVYLKILIILWWNWSILYRLSFKRRHNAEVTSVHNHPYLDLIASGSCDYTVLVHDVMDCDIIKTKRVLDHDFYVHCVRWSPNGNFLAVAGQGVQIWDWREGKILHHFPKGYTRDILHRKKRLRRKEVKDCVWSPNGRYLLFCIGRCLTIYDVEKEIELARVKAQQGSAGNDINDIQCVCISPNMKYIAIGIFHSQINVFKFNPQISKNVNSSVNSSESALSQICELIHVIHGHRYSVNCISFDRSGQFLISGSSDTTIKIWDSKSGWQQVAGFTKHEREVKCLSIDVMNRYIASADIDGIIYVYHLKQFNSPSSDVTTDKNNSQETRENESPGKENKEQIKRKNSQHKNSIKECKEMCAFKAPSNINSIDFSPYNEFVACGCDDHNVMLLPLPEECATCRRGDQLVVT
ncbi:hypothetical protein RFI_33401 [Reticulomyxa filosa]|uniref:Anaphase-promoting complex subunit 4-like WD40 domain-containing protein n=1 Tax=Reticulomyxa filosa TaxID=46433 RepID=X6LQ36_RETFI|nr:hypothetical protein RFI_33401 [Reticulomyxa filosa]|eukprot:ETO04003.1 hypothetical protein RFI_33401 [Reticulomyxa filosa]